MLLHLITVLVAIPPRKAGISRNSFLFILFKKFYFWLQSRLEKQAFQVDDNAIVIEHISELQSRLEKQAFQEKRRY